MEDIILGENIRVSTDAAETQLNNNVIVVGPSGSGKTMSYCEMRLLYSYESSLIVTLSKRQLVKRYSAYLAEKGYEVLDLNLTDPSTGNVAFDPMKYVKDESDITYLAETIIMANPKKKTSKDADPFWDTAARSLLSALIAYTMHVKSRPSFTDVLDLFAKLKIMEQGEGISTTLDTLFDRYENEMPGSFAIQCWNTFRYSPFRTAGSIYSALSTTIDTVFTPQIRASMRNSRHVSFEDLAAKKTVLFLTTSAVNPSLNGFAGLLYSTAVKVLYELAEQQPDGRLASPIHLLCDDFAVGAPIPNFAESISIFREKNISVSILLQSESQLSSMYGSTNATTIINNCDTYIYMGGMDLATCRNIAERTGKPMSDILYLPLESVIVFRRGHVPFFTKRFQIMQDPEWIKANEMQ